MTDQPTIRRGQFVLTAIAHIHQPLVLGANGELTFQMLWGPLTPLQKMEILDGLARTAMGLREQIGQALAQAAARDGGSGR